MDSQEKCPRVSDCVPNVGVIDVNFGHGPASALDSAAKAVGEGHVAALVDKHPQGHNMSLCAEGTHYRGLHSPETFLRRDALKTMSMDTISVQRRCGFAGCDAVKHTLS